MAFRELTVPGAWEITPAQHGDSRGMFFEWFTEAGFAEMTGHASCGPPRTVTRMS